MIDCLSTKIMSYDVCTYRIDIPIDILLILHIYVRAVELELITGDYT